MRAYQPANLRPLPAIVGQRFNLEFWHISAFWSFHTVKSDFWFNMFQSRHVIESYTGGSYHIVGHTSRFTAMTLQQKISVWQGLLNLQYLQYQTYIVKLQVQISGQWLDLWGSYLEVEILSPKGSIDRDVSRGCHTAMKMTAFPNIRY